VQTTRRRIIEKQESENIPKVLVQVMINIRNKRCLNLTVVKPKTLVP